MPWNYTAGNQSDQNTSTITAILEQEITRIEGRSDEFNDLMISCMSKNPNERPTIDQILEHRFLEGASEMRENWLEDYQGWEEER